MLVGFLNVIFADSMPNKDANKGSMMPPEGPFLLKGSICWQHVRQNSQRMNKKVQLVRSRECPFPMQPCGEMRGGMKLVFSKMKAGFVRECCPERGRGSQIPGVFQSTGETVPMPNDGTLSFHVQKLYEQLTWKASSRPLIND